MRRIISFSKKPVTGKRKYRKRRSWTLEQKLAIVNLASADGANVSQVAREHDIDVRLLFQWLRDHQQGKLAQRTWGQPGKRKRNKETAPA